MKPKSAAHWMAMISNGEISPVEFMPKWAGATPGAIMADLSKQIRSKKNADDAIEIVCSRYEMSRERLVRFVESIGSGDPKWDRLCRLLGIS